MAVEVRNLAVKPVEFKTEVNLENLDPNVFSHQTITQAKNLIRFAGIELTPEITVAYGLLRTENSTQGDREKTTGDKAKDEQPAQPKSDQVIFAEALDLTNKHAARDEFKSHFPHIFNNRI